MIEITIKVDAARALLRLRNGQRKLVYAVVNSVNETARAVQAAEKRQLRSWVIVRTAFTQRRFAKIERFASAKRGRISALLEPVDTSAKSGLFLPWLEEGFTKASRLREGYNVNPGVQHIHDEGLTPVAITGGARPTRTQIIPDLMKVKSFGLRRSRKGYLMARQALVAKRRLARAGLPSQARGPWRGKRGTFMTHRGIWQRSGQHRGAVRLLWYLARHPVRVGRRTQFGATARRIAEPYLQRRLRYWIAEAFAHEAARAARTR